MKTSEKLKAGLISLVIGFENWEQVLVSTNDCAAKSLDIQKGAALKNCKIGVQALCPLRNLQNFSVFLQ
jgi:hypothetical protein